MSVVTFELVMPVDVPRDALWAGLVDWESHGDWIPTTRSQFLAGDGGQGQS